jgi:hypothetical protein
MSEVWLRMSQAGFARRSRHGIGGGSSAGRERIVLVSGARFPCADAA